ncbi:MAG: amidophosphoribosyltransferase [Christensenellales bacterium]|jgi:amidophosphoribosyltransferase
MKIREECGIFGVISKRRADSGNIVFAGLISQQHRGQESAGISAFKDGKIITHKGQGLVTAVFDSETLDKFNGADKAIGHVRYSTKGNNGFVNAQPITTSHKKATFALAHNGNIVNADKIRDKLENEYGVVFNTSNNCEAVILLIINEMIKGNDFITALRNVVSKIEGAYSMALMTEDYLIAVRDRVGFRPLCMGRTEDSIMVASESCALDSVDAQFIRDIEPGEIVIIDNGLNIRSIKDTRKAPKGLCSFEYIYFARQDSVIDGRSVYEMRKAMGKYLALQNPVEADLICGVPDSGLEGAKGYAEQSKIPYGSAFVLNRYIGRSFIYPTQKAREKAVRLKLNPLRAAVEDKRIVLVDDSIVRGTTCAKIISELRSAGAKEIHMRITAPLFKYSCYFGTDIDKPEGLIANRMSVEEIRKHIGADSLDFLSIENLLKISGEADPGFCVGCFSGKYPIDLDISDC